MPKFNENFRITNYSLYLQVLDAKNLVDMGTRIDAEKVLFKQKQKEKLINQLFPVQEDIVNYNATMINHKESIDKREEREKEIIGKFSAVENDGDIMNYLFVNGKDYLIKIKNKGKEIIDMFPVDKII